MRTRAPKGLLHGVFTSLDSTFGLPILRRSFAQCLMTDAVRHPPFRVLVRDLPAHRRVEVDGAYVAETLRGMPMRDAVAEVDAGSGTLDVHVYGEGENVHASGQMRGSIVVACGRCLGPATVPIDEVVQATYMPEAALAAAAAEEAAPAEEGVELAAEDLDVYPYDGEAVDLELIVKEQIILAVPYAPLCREDCKGLCPQCGVDRNVETCACEKPLDPRFAALKGLKLPS